jgi:hypothetical protein
MLYEKSEAVFYNKVQVETAALLSESAFSHRLRQVLNRDLSIQVSIPPLPPPESGLIEVTAGDQIIC